MNWDFRSKPLSIMEVSTEGLDVFTNKHGGIMGLCIR